MDTLNANHASPQVSLFCGEPTNDRSAPANKTQELPVDAELLSLFESMTGWVVEFQESRASQRLRSRVDRHNSVKAKYLPPVSVPHPTGEFVITDMSARWPAQRPTSHRGKCDRFMELLSEMVSKLQRFENELSRFQSASLNAEILESVETDVVDSFLPRYPYHTESEINGGFELNLPQSTQPDCVFVERHSDLLQLDEPAGLTTETAISDTPSTRWQIGGQRGLSFNRYIDWSMRADHRIELMIGQIEAPESLGDAASGGEWECKLTLNPSTNRYWFSGDDRADFWLLDHATKRLSPISRRDKVQELRPAQSVVLSTARLARNGNQSAVAVAACAEAALNNADELAAAIQQGFQLDEPVLVLSRYS